MGDNNDDKKADPGYYAVIPANVQYDKSLSPNAKLLYGEITALSNKEGYCWASNSYFANLYGVDKSSVSHWIKSLANAGYVKIELVYADGKPNIEKRKIYIADPLPGRAACRQGSDAGGGGELIHQGGEISHQGVVKNFNGGGEKTPERILQSNNTEEAAAADQIPQKTERPPPEAAAGPLISKNQDREETAGDEAEALKLHFKSLSPLLVFDESFYPRALRFLAAHDLDFGFVSWICEAYAKKKVNPAGYLFKVFFEERYAMLFREASRPPPEAPVELISCPACGAEYGREEPECPACGLEASASPSDVAFKKKFLSLPPDVRDEYVRRQDEIVSVIKEGYSSGAGQQVAALDMEFGLADEESG